MKLMRFVIAILIILFAFAAIPATSAQDWNSPTTLFFTEDGSFSVELYEGWYADGDASGLRVTNNENLLEDGALPTTSGDLVVELKSPSISDLENLGLTTDASLPEIAMTLQPSFTEGLSNITFSEIEEWDDGFELGAFMTFQSDAVEGFIAVAIPSYTRLDMLTSVYIVSPKGELDNALETGIDAISDVQFSPPLSEAFVSNNSGLAFNYPAGLEVFENYGGPVFLADSPDTIKSMINQNSFGEGEIRFMVIVQNDTGISLDEETLKGIATNLAEQVTSDTSQDEKTIEESRMLVSDYLVGTIAFTEFSTGYVRGGVLSVNNQGVLHSVVFMGDWGVGNNLLLRAINISNSITISQ